MTPRPHASASALCLMAVLLVLVQAWALPVRASEDVGARVRRVAEALADWQLDEAVAIATSLERDGVEEPRALAAIGDVRFHQGDYEAAVRYLSRASAAGAPAPLAALAQSTLEETRGFVAAASEHFVVRTPPGKDEVLHPIALWALEEAFKQLSVAFDYRPTHKIVVDVLHDARGLAGVSTLTVKEIETSGTIALCKFNRLMITSPKALARGYSWLDTLSHELIHLIVSEKSHNNVPVWLHEGIAKYDESRWRGTPGLALEASSEGLLAAAVKKERLITFEQMHPSMAKLPSQEDAALAFAEVFTVIEHIERERTPREGRRPVNVLLEGLRDGLDMDAALKRAVDVDLAGLQRDWKRYLTRRSFKVVPGAAARKLTFVKDARRGLQAVEEQEDEAALHDARSREGRQFVRLGNLLRDKRRLRAASIEYEKAIQRMATPNPGMHSPALHNRLAGVYLELGDVDGARRVLKETVAAFPDDPQTHVLLGRVALRTKDWPTARTHYERATWEAPFNPEIHVALLKVAEETRDDALLRRQRRAVDLLVGAARAAASVPARAAKGEPHGLLEVRAQPWGRVLLDGVDVGATTPLVDYPVKPGVHRVRVIDPVNGLEQGAEVRVVAGEKAMVELALQALDDKARAALVEAEDRLLRPLPTPPVTPSSGRDAAAASGHEAGVEAGAPNETMAPWERSDQEMSQLP